MVTELTTQNFEDFISENKIALIDCWAPWCGPCRRLSPIIEDLAGELAGKVGVAKLNTDDNGSIARRYAISAIPTLLIFKEGELVQTLVGLRSKDDIKSYVMSV
jgi:thioredoxin 1